MLLCWLKRTPPFRRPSFHITVKNDHICLFKLLVWGPCCYTRWLSPRPNPLPPPHPPNLSLTLLLFPLLRPRVVCSLCLALCSAEASGYEAAGWLSETVVSVWQSPWYISPPLPCIIDSPSLITVCSVTDEPLLPAAPCTPRSLWELESCRGVALMHAGGAQWKQQLKACDAVERRWREVAVFYLFMRAGGSDIKLLLRWAFSRCNVTTIILMSLHPN